MIQLTFSITFLKAKFIKKKKRLIKKPFKYTTSNININYSHTILTL